MKKNCKNQEVISPSGIAHLLRDPFSPMSSRKEILKRVQDDRIKNYKCAFTLAEVLITLAIVGVVAALTLPSLIANYQKKQTVTQLKKVYSEFTQAVELAKIAHGDIKEWDFENNTSADVFDIYLKSFMKLEENDFALIRESIKYKMPGGGQEVYLAIMNKNRKTSYTVLSSGALVIYLDGDGGLNPNYKSFYVDLNGFKKPNTFGKDMFVIALSRKMGLQFARWDDDEVGLEVLPWRTRDELINGESGYNYQCRKGMRGLWCGALIQMDGWQIKDDYPF